MEKLFHFLIELLRKGRYPGIEWDQLTFSQKESFKRGTFTHKEFKEITNSIY